MPRQPREGARTGERGREGTGEASGGGRQDARSLIDARARLAQTARQSTRDSLAHDSLRLASHHHRLSWGLSSGDFLATSGDWLSDWRPSTVTNGVVRHPALATDTRQHYCLASNAWAGVRTTRRVSGGSCMYVSPTESACSVRGDVPRRPTLWPAIARPYSARATRRGRTYLIVHLLRWRGTIDLHLLR